jgi:hypothetical protein
MLEELRLRNEKKIKELEENLKDLRVSKKQLEDKVQELTKALD